MMPIRLNVSYLQFIAIIILKSKSMIVFTNCFSNYTASPFVNNRVIQESRAHCQTLY